ncbi:MAG: AAA family ATPase [Deltaproteobacteria bacterium]|nr:AAA family ATPase [Deltaproteobacteria bacterium]
MAAKKKSGIQQDEKMDIPQTKPEGLKLRHIKVRNFKALDDLELDFPPPRMSYDPDVIVIGSRNGVGKTSVLESCALLVLAEAIGPRSFLLGRSPEMPIDVLDLLIRTGAAAAGLEGTFRRNSKESKASVNLEKSGWVDIREGVGPVTRSVLGTLPNQPDLLQPFLFSLMGLNAEPIISPHCLYFHSYRKVSERNPELGMLVSGERLSRTSRYGPGFDSQVSTFKFQLLQAMMGKAQLFDTSDNESAGDALGKLNELVERYAGGTIGKLRPSEDNAVDFRIHPIKGGESFTFNGLSSGQKEIISTLFLIWYHSRKVPKVVLIDEPELHLNAEWHSDFVRQIFALAPENQYIIASHSKHIFASVEADRRILLSASEEAVT